MGHSEQDERLLGRQSTSKNYEFLEYSTPNNRTIRGKKGKINSPSTASFFAATTKPHVGILKKSKTTKLLYLLKHEQSGHRALKQQFAAHSHCLVKNTCSLTWWRSYSAEKKKKRLKANMAQPEPSPGSGLIICLSPTPPLHVPLTPSHIRLHSSTDYGSKTKCTQLVSPLCHTQTASVCPCCTGDLFCLTHPPLTVLLIK